MAFTPLNSADAIEGGAGADLLPAGAYVCVITDAKISQSKKGQIALLVTWDVAEGEHVGHFGAAQYGHTEWLMLEGNGAPYSTHKINVISASNSQPPVTFDALGVANQYATQYDAMGRIGDMPVAELVGRYVGLVIGTEDQAYQGNVSTRNVVSKWLTPAEVRAGKTADGKPISVPKHKALSPSAAQAAQAQAAPATIADDEIPF